ncbi:MAG: hypothetical protein JKY37_12790 [Nannocystaceae bacterium]|nr:hypothetical protein [Nannocystaceae bacterium]
MPSQNSVGLAGAGLSSTDLVAELHNQADERVLEVGRQRRRRHRRRIIGVVIAVVVLAVSAVAGKIAWDQYRLNHAVKEARTHLLAGTSGELRLAAEAAEKGLAVAPTDDVSRELLAMVRAHQAAAGGSTEALAQALTAITESQSQQSVLARAVAAALAGELDAVADTLQTVEPGGEPPVARLHAWLHATVALGNPYETERMGPALAELEEVAQDEQWVPVHRRYAAALLRAGSIDEAKARLETARALDPAGLGLAIDEALLHAIVTQHSSGVRDVAERLLADESLSPRDRGRLHLARALVNTRRRNGKGIAEDIDAAWEHVPAWDVDSRARIIEAAFLAGELKRAKALLKQLEVDETTADVHVAWAKLIEGDVAGSLEDCAKLPQTHARVAYVQALALVEQKRFTESTPWLERALGLYGPRLELRVADARTKAHVGDPKLAGDALGEIAKAHRTARALTALGEAQLLIAGDDGETDAAEKTLRQALETEDRPAEAAFLLAGLVQMQAKEDPEKAPAAIALLEKAVEFDGVTVRYRASLGRYLASHGDLDDADNVLRTLVDEEVVTADSLLDLVVVALDRADLGYAKVEAKDVGAWLDKAAGLRANPVTITVLRERLRLLAPDSETELPTIGSRLAAILQSNPGNLEARLLYGETLRRQREFPIARTTLRDGGQSSDKYGDGRLFIARATVERRDGSDRLAAALAKSGWDKLNRVEVAPNERIRLARLTAQFFEDVENLPAQRAITKALVKHLPWRADAWAFRALTQLANDKNEEGCANAKKALKIDDTLAEAHSARAECWISSHHYPDARAELAKAVELARSSAEKRAYKRRLRVLR